VSGCVGINKDGGGVSLSAIAKTAVSLYPILTFPLGLLKRKLNNSPSNATSFTKGTVTV
jgi:hypothetical protein